MNIVIMAGGRGTRFWPSSTESKPKQFLPLLTKRTMLQDTYDRFKQWLPASNIYVATSKSYISLVMEQLPELTLKHIIIEPDSRDTGPSTALTALTFLHQDDDDVIVMVPSDQYISDNIELSRTLHTAANEARTRRITVMLGIVPTRAETGYGYIRTYDNHGYSSLREVEAFIEKPNQDYAEKLIKLGTYWNSGIFVWRPSTIEYLMTKHCPSIWQPLKKHYPEVSTIYSQLPKLSIDYAVIEKAKDLYVIPATFDWDDVGTWNAVRRHYGSDEHGNLLNGHVRSLDSHGNIIFTDKQAIVIGVDDLIVVSTEEGLLVCHRSEEQRIKEMLNERSIEFKPYQLREVKPNP